MEEEEEDEEEEKEKEEEEEQEEKEEEEEEGEEATKAKGPSAPVSLEKGLAEPCAADSVCPTLAAGRTPTTQAGPTTARCRPASTPTPAERPRWCKWPTGPVSRSTSRCVWCRRRRCLRSSMCCGSCCSQTTKVETWPNPTESS